MANELNRVDEAEGKRLERTLSGQYDKKDSVEARAYERREKQDAEEEQRMAKEQMYAETLTRATIEDEQEVARMNVARRQMILKHQVSVSSGSIAKKARGAFGFARWTGIGIAGIAYAVQFAFGLISLLLVVGHTFVAESLVGKIIGIFVDVNSVFPLESAGWAFWALASLVAICTFVGFLLWFYLTGAHTTDTTVMTLVTALTFALSILPVTNLFPAIPIWFIFVNARSTAEWLKVLKPGKSAVMGGV